MKKVLTLTSVLALVACGQSLNSAQHDADFAGCERVDTTKMHLVYKCPANMERFAQVKTMEANALFQEGGALVWDEVNADTANVYVEVVGGKWGKIDECQENFHYRTKVKPVNGEEMYAVITCKTPVEAKAEEAPATEEAAK